MDVLDLLPFPTYCCCHQRLCTLNFLVGPKEQEALVVIGRKAEWLVCGNTSEVKVGILLKIK